VSLTDVGDNWHAVDGRGGRVRVPCALFGVRATMWWALERVACCVLRVAVAVALELDCVQRLRMCCWRGLLVSRLYFRNII